MRYRPLSPQFYYQNRQNIISEIEEESLVLLLSHDLYPRSGDTTYPFRQNPSLLYLSGIDQEDTILALSPWHPNPAYREILFIKNHSPEMTLWNGPSLSKEKAAELSGISTILFADQLNTVLHDLMNHAKHVYLHLPEIAKPFDIRNKETRFANELKKKYPLHDYRRLAPILQASRGVKHAEELSAIKKACTITGDAFSRVLRIVKPGMFEYEIEAELTYEFCRQGCTGHAFSPIVASGKNSCVLHYAANDDQLQDGDLLLLDFGAEYANYASDCTRVIPVNGKFTPRQKEVYNSVLTIFKELLSLFKPGMSIDKLNAYTNRRMEEELIKLGLFTEEDVKNQNPDSPLFKKYYMHGVSHYIGLDVHDAGEKGHAFQPGNILSCEPGIYIPEENIGIRLETTMAVAENPVNLMPDIPIEIDDIEEYMQQSHRH